MAYSFDGIIWTAIPNSTSIFSTACRGIAWSPNLKLWIAVGAGTNNVAYSYDGITWTTLSNQSCARQISSRSSRRNL